MPVSKDAYLVQFSSRPVAEELDRRRRADEDSRGIIAARYLERYLALLQSELRTIDLTEAEALLICDAGNGTWWEPTSIRLIWAEIEDAIRLDGLDQKWQVDGAALVEKLRRLCPGQLYALATAIELFWLDPNAPDRLVAVGLVKRKENEDGHH